MIRAADLTRDLSREEAARERFSLMYTDPDLLAKQQAVSLVEYFQSFSEGNQPYFLAIFIDSDKQHVRQHEHFVSDLDILPTPDLIGPPDPIVKTLGNVSLEKTYQFSDDGSLHSTFYCGVPARFTSEAVEA
jgi:hypothetical protein